MREKERMTRFMSGDLYYEVAPANFQKATGHKLQGNVYSNKNSALFQVSCQFYVTKVVAIDKSISSIGMKVELLDFPLFKIIFTCMWCVFSTF